MPFVKPALTLSKHQRASVAAMSGPCSRLILRAALVAAGIVVPAALQAQESVAVPCLLCSVTPGEVTNAPPVVPLRLQVETRLDFDKVVFQGPGSALVALSPDGVARLSGAASAAGARAMPGSVIVRGEPGRAVRVDLPRQVILFGEGSGSLRIELLTTDLPPLPRIGADGTLIFRFGGDLQLSGDSDGAFHGMIDIVVDYL